MSQQRSRADGARGGAARGGGLGHLALAAALLVLVALGLRGTVPAPALNGSYRHDGLLLAASAEAVLGCLLAALLVRRLRAPEDAIIAVYAYSRGYPRLINTICENALISAYAKQSATVTARIIEDVANEFRLEAFVPVEQNT